MRTRSGDEWFATAHTPTRSTDEEDHSESDERHATLRDPDACRGLLRAWRWWHTVGLGFLLAFLYLETRLLVGSEGGDMEATGQRREWRVDAHEGRLATHRARDIARLREMTAAGQPALVRDVVQNHPLVVTEHAQPSTPSHAIDEKACAHLADNPLLQFACQHEQRAVLPLLRPDASDDATTGRYVCERPTYYTIGQERLWNKSISWLRSSEGGTGHILLPNGGKEFYPLMRYFEYNGVWPKDEQDRLEGEDRWSIREATNWVNTLHASGARSPYGPLLPIPLPDPLLLETEQQRLTTLLQPNVFMHSVPLPVCTAALLAQRQFEHAGYWLLRSGWAEALPPAEEADLPARARQVLEGEREHARAEEKWDAHLRQRLVWETADRVSRPGLAAARSALERAVSSGRQAENDRQRGLALAQGLFDQLLSKDAARAAEVRAEQSSAWEPVYSCTYCHLLPVSYLALLRSGCLAGERWLFMGDSLTRYHWMDLVHFVHFGEWAYYGFGANQATGEPSLQVHVEFENHEWPAYAQAVRDRFAPYMRVELDEGKLPKRSGELMKDGMSAREADERCDFEQRTATWVYTHPLLNFSTTFLFAAGVGAKALEAPMLPIAFNFAEQRRLMRRAGWSHDEVDRRVAAGEILPRRGGDRTKEERAMAKQMGVATLVSAGETFWDFMLSICGKDAHAGQGSWSDVLTKVRTWLTSFHREFPLTQLVWRSVAALEEPAPGQRAGCRAPRAGMRHNELVEAFEAEVKEICRQEGHWYHDVHQISGEFVRDTQAFATWDGIHHFPFINKAETNWLLTRICTMEQQPATKLQQEQYCVRAD